MARQKTSPVACPRILPFVLKYLNSIENVDSYSPHTLRSYRVDLGQAFGIVTAPDPEILRKGVGKQIGLTDDQILGLCRSAMANWGTLAPASRNRKAACLKSFLNWLFENQYIGRELGLHVHGPKVPHRLPHHLSVDEVTALLKTLGSEVKLAGSEKDRLEAQYTEALVLLLYGGGLRVSEACGARWKDLDVASRVIRIKGKGGKERLVALPDRVLKALSSLPHEGHFVFGKDSLSTRSAYEQVRTAGARAGLLQPLHPHALRHSFATHLLTSGANLRTLQELLGHQTLQATQRYTHIGLDQLANTLEKFHPHGNAHPVARKRSAR
jgi:site-specific recombinase XerD